jgi:hypothetical protein
MSVTETPTPTPTPKRAPKGSEPLPLWLRLLSAAALFVLLAGAIGAIMIGQAGGDAQEAVTTTQGQLETANSKVEAGGQLAGANIELCMDPEIVALLKARGRYGVCDLAVAVQQATVQGKPGENGAQGEQGPGPSEDQIDRAVTEYFAAHPLPEGKTPTVAQVTSVVADYLRANPPAPGRPPTPEEIATAVAAYIADHPNDFRGKDGTDGTPGRPPTAEEVRAVVEDYCSTGRCQGPKGDKGDQGIGITATNLKRDENNICTLYFTAEDPADGSTTQLSVQVNDELCPALPTETEKPTETTTTEPTDGEGGG